MTLGGGATKFALGRDLRRRRLFDSGGSGFGRSGRAVALDRRDAAEAHAARMRDLCPRNADLIKVEEIAAD
jgi:hypothetical protein